MVISVERKSVFCPTRPWNWFEPLKNCVAWANGARRFPLKFWQRQIFRKCYFFAVHWYAEVQYSDCWGKRQQFRYKVRETLKKLIRKNSFPNFHFQLQEWMFFSFSTVDCSTLCFRKRFWKQILYTYLRTGYIIGLATLRKDFLINLSTFSRPRF